MRKGRDGETEKKIMVKIVATTSLPVDRLTATDCNAASRANNGENSCPPLSHLLIASGYFPVASCRLLLATFYVLLATYYLLLAICLLLLSTFYFIFATSTTSYLELANCYFLLGT